MLTASVVGLAAVIGVFVLGDLHHSPAERGGEAVRAAALPAEAAPASSAAAPTAEPRPELPAARAPTPPAGARSAPEPVASRPQPKGLPQSPELLDSDEPPYDITRRGEEPPTGDRTSYLSWMKAHTDQKDRFLVQKWALAESMVAMRSLTHRRVLEALLIAPREFFCRDSRRAYEDAVLPIGYGQTISGPHMVARMTDYLDPQPEQKVLEIGTGSGYQSAVLSELSNHVYTIEIVEPLARETDAIYRAHEARYPEYRNIHRRIADGYYGWPEQAPFDRIIVTCGIDHVPPELLRELAPEGIMIIPVGPPSGQTILRIVKHVQADGTVTLDREDIFHGKKRQIFVPFTSGGGGVHASADLEETK